ncbi:MAG: alanine racemase [Bacteroidota bacterium]
MKITEPTLVLNKDICLRNIERMMAKAKRHDLIFRPHFKTHQSHEIGRWFREYGVEKITVSSLKMAEYFAEDQWGNITVAFPANILEIDRINQLAGKIQLNLIVESIEVARILQKELQHTIGIFLTVDVGYHRTGIASNDYAKIDAILQFVDIANQLDFKGFLTHAGHSYSSKGIDEIRAVHESSLTALEALRKNYISRYPNLIISTGDTPTCSVMEDFRGVDEIRPGNFVFYDLTQLEIGACREEDIAVAMACPVVAKHQDRMELIIYGGGVHFSKDRLEVEGKTSFGKPVRLTEHSWELAYHEVNYVSKLSQEHGTLKVEPEVFDEYQEGDLIGILPVHSCMTANLMKGYYLFDGSVFDRL